MYLTVGTLLLELGLLTLEERRHQMDMAQVHKMLKGIDNVDTETLFTMASTHGRHTRNADAPLNLRQGVSRLEVRKNFFTQRVVVDWNRIPGEIKTLKSAQAFKRSYRKLRSQRVHAAGGQ